MKSLMQHWKEGLSYLFSDENLISFYTFFTVILAECVYLRSVYANSIVMPFVIIFLGYIVNILVCAWLKGNWEGTRLEVVFTIIYCIVFIMLFIIGCFINMKVSIIMTAIPLMATAIAIWIREKFCNILAQIVVVGIPIVAFAVSIFSFSTFQVAIKAIILVIYALCVPFIPYIEDNTAALNIFEMAFDVTWNKELEEYLKKFSKH